MVRKTPFSSNAAAICNFAFRLVSQRTTTLGARNSGQNSSFAMSRRGVNEVMFVIGIALPILWQHQVCLQTPLGPKVRLESSQSLWRELGLAQRRIDSCAADTKTRKCSFEVQSLPYGVDGAGNDSDILVLRHEKPGRPGTPVAANVQVERSSSRSARTAECWLVYVALNKAGGALSNRLPPFAGDYHARFLPRGETDGLQRLLPDLKQLTRLQKTPARSPPSASAS